VGARDLIVASALAIAIAACGGARPATTPAPAPAAAVTPDRVVADFERAVRTSRDAFVDLFDFDAVGAVEILLRREYYLANRDDLDDDERARYERDDGTPYPAARERRNVGNFYPRFVQRTVGTGGCHADTIRGDFNRTLAAPQPPLPADSAAWEPLRVRTNALLAAGGAVELRCTGGAGAITLVWTRAEVARGYALITMYDDPD
jgi:hypothetical protein